MNKENCAVAGCLRFNHQYDYFVIMVFSEWGVFIKRLITSQSPGLVWSPATGGQRLVMAWVCVSPTLLIQLIQTMRTIKHSALPSDLSYVSYVREDCYMGLQQCSSESLYHFLLSGAAGNCKISPESGLKTSSQACILLPPGRPGEGN